MNDLVESNENLLTVACRFADDQDHGRQSKTNMKNVIEFVRNCNVMSVHDFSRETYRDTLDKMKLWIEIGKKFQKESKSQESKISQKKKKKKKMKETWNGCDCV